MEDLKTMKDIGVKEKGSTIYVQEKNEMEMDAFLQTEQFDENALQENISTLKAILGDALPHDKVIKQALKKCSNNMEDALLLLTNDATLNDLEEEVMKQEALE